jgi:hypothetical protein
MLSQFHVHEISYVGRQFGALGRKAIGDAACGK